MPSLTLRTFDRGPRTCTVRSPSRLCARRSGMEDDLAQKSLEHVLPSILYSVEHISFALIGLADQLGLGSCLEVF